MVPSDRRLCAGQAPADLTDTVKIQSSDCRKTAKASLFAEDALKCFGNCDSQSDCFMFARFTSGWQVVQTGPEAPRYYAPSASHVTGALTLPLYRIQTHWWFQVIKQDLNLCSLSSRYLEMLQQQAIVMEQRGGQILSR